MKEKVKRGIPIGIPSVLLLLAVLGLTVFAVLSVRASYGELKRAESSAEALAAYYKADSTATETEFRMNELLSSAQPENDSEVAEVLKGISGNVSVEDGIITYRVPVAEETSLVCRLYYANDAERTVRVGRQFTATTQSGYNHGLIVLETEIID